MPPPRPVPVPPPAPTRPPVPPAPLPPPTPAAELVVNTWSAVAAQAPTIAAGTTRVIRTARRLGAKERITTLLLSDEVSLERERPRFYRTIRSAQQAKRGSIRRLRPRAA